MPTANLIGTSRIERVPARWPSADVLRQASVGAMPFRLAAGERKVQNLQLP